MDIKPGASNKLYGLDHLRALAITMVFMYHAGHMFPSPQWVTAVGQFGWAGVDLFFVLSGYLIASQLFLKMASGQKIALKTFFIKRFFRIIPAYLFVVAIYFCFPFTHEREGLAPLWKYLTFTQNLGLNIGSQGTFSHAWSLCIEEQFYLCLPLILTALVYFKAARKGYLIIIGLFVVGIAARYYAYRYLALPHMANEGGWIYWYKWVYYPTYARLDGLVAGVSIAALSCFRPLWMQRAARYGNLFLLSGATFFIIITCIQPDERSFFASIFGFPVVDVVCGLMVLGAVSRGSFLYKYNSKITTGLATLSYSLYLIHKITIHITHVQCAKLNIADDSNLLLLLCIITALIVAVIMNVVIEKPFLRLRELLLERT